MNRNQADALYEANWDLKYTSMDALYDRIRKLAENGSYTCCVYVDSKKQYNEVYNELHTKGYSVDHYNGGNNNIIEIAWG